MPDEITRDADAALSSTRDGLRPAEPSIVEPSTRGYLEEGSICIEMNERCTDAMEPTECLEGHKAGVPDDNEPLESSRCSRNAAGTSLPSEAVPIGEMPTLDADGKAIPIEHQDAVGCDVRVRGTRTGSVSVNLHAD